METISTPTFLVIDIKEVLLEYLAVPKEERHPALVLNENLTEAEYLDLEIETLTNLITVKHHHLDSIYEYCSDYIANFDEFEDNGKARETNENDTQALLNYTENIAALASNLGSYLDRHGFYNEHGYLHGEFHKVINHHLLVLSQGIDLEQ